jgi:hypothetical protein
LIDTMIPPAFQLATMAMTNCGTFCRYTASRSPGAKPLASSPLASASLSSSSSRRVMTPSKYRSATAEGSRATPARNMSSASSNSIV